MNASELITELQTAIGHYGDLSVVDHRGEDIRAVEHHTHDDPEVPEVFHIW